jgi:ceramide glucosyltransferase
MTATIASVLLGGTAVVSAVYFFVSARLLRRWLEQGPAAESGDEPLPPATFFRPLKAGVPDLRSKLESLARAMQAGDQLIIGVETGSAEETVVAEVACSFSGKEIAVVRCEPGRALNPKVSKLVQMVEHARHEHWILSDSEAALDTEFLRSFRHEWRHCDVLTAGYRFEGARTRPQRLDAMAILLTLWPGLAVLSSRGSLRLTLGACTGFRRADLAAIGGWAAFGDALAEDHQLGVALAAAGRKILLSRKAATLASDPLTWRDYWRHQRRIAITYRVSNPLGFAGAWLTQGVTAAFILVCLHPGWVGSWALFVIVWAARVLSVQTMSRRLKFPLPNPWLDVLLASLVETMCWALSWASRSVWWGGTRWRIGSDGRLRPRP